MLDPSYLVGEALKFFFLLTPFVVLTSFISFSRGCSARDRRRFVGRFFRATVMICVVLFAGGNLLFQVMAISVDSFRCGAGMLLMMNALALARGMQPPMEHRDEDFSVVPLALPIAIGPGTIGTLLVMRASAEHPGQVAMSLGALLAALLAVGGMLLISDRIERSLGRLGISILSRMTGLVLAAFSAQLILTGLRNVLLGP